MFPNGCVVRYTLAVATLSRDRAHVAKAMRAVRSRDTSPERRLRKLLWERGCRYRLNSKLAGKPDLVFPGARVAVFVDGDFWHGNQWRNRGFPSIEAQMERVSGGAYWVEKIRRNVDRDLKTTRALQAGGWTVVRVWESELRQDPERAVSRVTEELGKRRK